MEERNQKGNFNGTNKIKFYGLFFFFSLCLRKKQGAVEPKEEKIYKKIRGCKNGVNPLIFHEREALILLERL